MITLVRTCYDESTKLSFKWSEPIKAALDQSKIHYNDCSNVKATRKDLEIHISGGTKVIIFYGHGSAFELLGQEEHERPLNGRVPVLDPLNASQCRVNLIYAFACSSARGLGKWMHINNYCDCYIGFKGAISVPLRNDVEFFECINSGILAMINRNTNVSSNEALSIMENKFFEVYKRLCDGFDPLDFTPEDLMYLGNLIQAKELLTMIGSPVKIM